MVGKLGRKSSLVRPALRWEECIKIEFEEIEWWVDWIYLARDRHRCPVAVLVVNNRLVPKSSGNFFEKLKACAI